MKVLQIQKNAVKEILSCDSAKELEALRVKYLGRKGKLTMVLRSLKDLPLKERRTIGPKAQKLKSELEFLIGEKLEEFKNKAIESAEFDITAPGKKVSVGHIHPLTKVLREIKDIFRSMGFSIIDGPEIETEYYNFDALNIPPDHPARDMWDTFWIKKDKKGKGRLLRTHTSPVQVRFMEKNEPPFQIIAPGRAFRYEATDASHETNFYQVEGLVVGKDISLANLKYTLETFFKRLFTKNIKLRFRPSYFPFVEPGLEIDISCVRCKQKGCSVCGRTGWLEIVGAGMVHPHVFEYAHYNPGDYQGFAFGMGLDRITMLKYNIPDIRLFYSGDIRFIKQF